MKTETTIDCVMNLLMFYNVSEVIINALPHNYYYPEELVTFNNAKKNKKNSCNNILRSQV